MGNAVKKGKYAIRADIKGDCHGCGRKTIKCRESIGACGGRIIGKCAENSAKDGK